MENPEYEMQIIPQSGSRICDEDELRIASHSML